MHLKQTSNHYLYVADTVKVRGSYHENILKSLGHVRNWNDTCIAELKRKLPQLDKNADLDKFLEEIKLSHRSNGAAFSCFNSNVDSAQTQPSQQPAPSTLPSKAGTQMQQPTTKIKQI